MRAIARARAVCLGAAVMVVMQEMRCIFNANQGARSLLLLLLLVLPGIGRADQVEATLYCDDPAALDPLLAGAVKGLGARAIDAISVSGLSAIDEARLWTLLESEPAPHPVRRGAPIDVAAAAALLLRLQRSELFAEIDVEPDPAGATMRLRLAEYPLVSGATIHGLRESSPVDLLAHFLGSPSEGESDNGREPTNTLRFQVWRKRMDHGPPHGRCQSAPPDPRWFARVEGGEVERGILRGGMEAARLRAVGWLRDRGYPHAAVTASIAPDGALVIDADEGRLVSFEVRGVPPSLRAEVERTLGFRAGDVFSSAALRQAVARLTARFPFVHLDTERALDEGSRATRSNWAGAKSGRADLGDIYLSWDYEDGGKQRGEDRHDHDRGASSAGTAVEVISPGRMVLWLRTRRVSIDMQWIQLIRHTPATGFAPGLAATLHLWDAEDRAHLAVDGVIAVNTKRAARPTLAGADRWERLSAQEGVDGLAGVRVAVPAWKLAELGAQVYALTDTNDAWRMSDVNSYVHSALQAVPDREYFRRAGATALATIHLVERLTLGAELHRDRFDALPNPRVWSLLNSGAPAPAAAPVTAAEIGSLLLRAEWSSDPIPLLRVGRIHRHPEVSLSDHPNDPGPTFLTLATLELGNRALGSDPGIGYLHALSDSRLQLVLGDGLLVRLRLRAGAGSGLTLVDEALGGWSALRGYAFKELRGDASVLGNVEARWRWLGAFADVGSVHQPGGWVGPRSGAGVQLFLEHIGSLEVAWRLDGNGSLAPSARALVGWEL